MGQPAWDTARSCAPGAAAAGPPQGDCTRPNDPVGQAKTDVAPPAGTGRPACDPLSFLAAAPRRNAERLNRTRSGCDPQRRPRESRPSAAPCPAWLCKVDERNSGASLCDQPVIQPPSSGPRPPPGRRYSPHAGPPPTPTPDLPGTAHKTNRIARSSTACSDRTDRDNAARKPASRRFLEPVRIFAP